MRKTLIALTAAGLVLSAAPAQANLTGEMTHSEWTNICTLNIIRHSGHVQCTRGTFQSEVEDNDNVTGENVNSYTQGGHDFKTIRYATPYPEYTWVVYRQQDSGRWETDSATWRVGGGPGVQETR